MMQARRFLWATVLAMVLAACAGGSGSSGFDVTSENAAITQALDEQHCVSHQALMICPAAETSPAIPGATPTAPPQRTATLAPLATATPTFGSRATATPTPTVAPHVDIGVSPADGVACAAANGSQTCSLLVPFMPEGFPASFTYRVAARTDPNGRWTISGEPEADGNAAMPNFDATVGLNGVTNAPSAGALVQVAILVFDHTPGVLPVEVEALADTAAIYAFVTADLTVHASSSARSSP